MIGKFTAYISLLCAVFIIAGCAATPMQTPEPTFTEMPLPTATVEATPMPTPDVPEVSDAQKLEEYNAFIQYLSGKEPCEAVVAFNALVDMGNPLPNDGIGDFMASGTFVDMGDPLPDEAVDTFLAFMQELCYLLELPGVTYELDEQHRTEYAKYFMHLQTGEGLVWAIPDMAAIGTDLRGKVSPEYKAYFELAQREQEQGLLQLVTDGTLKVSWNQLADYLAGQQAFIDAYPNFSQTELMRQDLIYPIGWYDGTFPLPARPPFNKYGLKPDTKQSYEYFLENYKHMEGSDLYIRIFEVEKLWRENDYKLTNDVKDFLQADEWYYTNKY